MTSPRPRPIVTAVRSAIETLEDRRLFAVIGSPLADISGNPGGTGTVNAAAAFNDDTATFVQVTTSLGNYRVQLFDSRKPGTVQNFLRYVNADRYDGLIIHRSDTLGGSTVLPPTILQGGGYVFPGFNHVATFPPIVNEFTSNGIISNTRGTLAMAKSSNPDSATSEWFLNLSDNSADLDDTGNSGGFTVFAKVVDADLPIVDAIAAVPRFAFASPFSTIPLRNYTNTDFSNSVTPGANNVISTTTDIISDVLTYSVSSSDPSIAAASVDAAGQVALTYGSTVGTATVTVTATGVDGVTTGQTTFDVGVGQLDVTIGGTSGNKSVSFTDADGTVSTVSVKGAGTATVRFTGTDLAQTANKGKISVAGAGGAALSLVSIAGSDASTAVTITGKGGDGVTSLQVLSADGALKSLTASKTNLTGAITTVGAVGTINLLSANNAALNLGGTTSDKGVKITAGDFVDTDIISGAPLASVKLRSDTGTDGLSDVISAPGITSLTITGNSSATITSVGEPNINKITIGGDFSGSISGHQIASLTVKGNLTGATINAIHAANEHADAREANLKQNQAIGKLAVGGAIVNSVVDTAGSVGSITAGSVSSSRLFIGLLGQTLVPTTVSQLTQEATLNVLTIKGTLASTDIASRFLGKLNIGSVTTDNGGAPFGLAGDSLTLLNARKADGTRITIKNVTTQAEFDASIGAIGLGDWNVAIL
ncbi:peptidylprolyl isomerase [Humisphaera borealis]|uniref:peptidylprolyl isomerase n=1 Tax=Humisphaera borealis TaxID=2807512 RepID=A0A7M2WTI1_9BACT|nr:peptidylprolyl isomerase [Humisphaera borealis]QOV88827.1 peptidylprolyl isomerase [Humisphaera borealis]